MSRTIAWKEKLGGLQKCKRRVNPVYAVPIDEPFRVVKDGKMFQYGEAGDYLVHDIYGENHVVGKAEFERHYEFI